MFFRRNSNSNLEKERLREQYRMEREAIDRNASRRARNVNMFIMLVFALLLAIAGQDMLRDADPRFVIAIAGGALLLLMAK